MSANYPRICSTPHLLTHSLTLFAYFCWDFKIKFLVFCSLFAHFHSLLHSLTLMNFLQLVSRVTSRRLSGATTTARLSLSSLTHSHTHSSSALPVEPKSFMRNDFINKDGKVVHYGFHVDRSNDGILDLEVKNPHELDSHITFNEDVHQYYYDGKLLDHTCTGLITSFFEKFDSKMIITKMMSGNAITLCHCTDCTTLYCAMQ